jgi:hypothetical protein
MLLLSPLLLLLRQTPLPLLQCYSVAALNAVAVATTATATQGIPPHGNALNVAHRPGEKRSTFLTIPHHWDYQTARAIAES